MVGIPDAGRNRSQIERLIGFFVNPLAIRSDLSGDLTFRELLDRVRDAAMGAYAYRNVPFERILIELAPQRRLDRTPIFQVFFNLVPFERVPLDLAGVDAELTTVPELGAKFDLTVYVRDGAEIDLTLVYNADLFTAERASELLEQYVLLLSQVAAAPDQRLSRYSLVTAPARRSLPDPARPLPATLVPVRRS